MMASSTNLFMQSLRFNQGGIDTSKIPVQRLTQQELSKMECIQEIYVLIRMLDVTEKFYNYDKIKEEDYNKQITKLLTKYSNFSKMIKDFNIDSFKEEYGLQDCTWALECIKKGVPGHESNTNAIFVKVANILHHIDDLIFMHKQKISVGNIKGPLDELILFLKKIAPKIESNFPCIPDLEKFLNEVVNKKTLGDIFSLEEFEKLTTIMADANRRFNLAVELIK